jgi:hypothetical protein
MRILRVVLAGPGLAAIVAAGACTGATTSASLGADPRPVPDAAAYAEAARSRVVGAGVSVGEVTAVTGPVWRSAAEGQPTLGRALVRAQPKGVRIEPGERTLCARSAESTDCMFVTVLGRPSSRVRLAEVDPDEVEAVVIVRTAPPDPEARMVWREELRTGRLFVFLRGWRPPHQP